MLRMKKARHAAGPFLVGWWLSRMADQTTPISQSTMTTLSGTPSSQRMSGIGSLPCLV
jgi:hypothetical protein